MSDFLAIILGASSWPRSGRLPPSVTFKNSADDFQKSLLAADGLALETNEVLDLFDDPRSVDDIDDAIDKFLVESSARLGREPKNVIIYYSGHGAFVEGDNKYCLTLRNSRLESLSTSAYRVSALARRLNQQAPNARRFVILDACFAAAALPDFIPQSDAATRMQNETLDALAESGTALLCAASSADVALAPVDGKYTMFSGAILDALVNGSKDYGSALSFENVGTLAERNIKIQFKDLAVKPEIHIPDQRRGSIARITLFPNPASRAVLLRDQVDRLQHRLDEVIAPALSELSSMIKGLEQRLHAYNEDNRMVVDGQSSVANKAVVERQVIGWRYDQRQVMIMEVMTLLICTAALGVPVFIVGTSHGYEVLRQMFVLGGSFVQLVIYGYLIYCGMSGRAFRPIDTASPEMVSTVLKDDGLGRIAFRRYTTLFGEVAISSQNAIVFGLLFLVIAIIVDIWLFALTL